MLLVRGKEGQLVLWGPKAGESKGVDVKVRDFTSDDEQPITMIHSVSLGGNPVVGGIESWISDFLSFSSHRYRILGTLFDRDTAIEAGFLTPELEAFSIARLPRQRTVIPHALRLVAGIFRNRELLTSNVVIHRPELAPFIRLIRPDARITLVIHTDLSAQVGSGSDSLWRFFGPLYFFFESFFLRFADHIIAHTVKDGPRLRQKFPGVTVVPGWYNDEHFGVSVPARERSGVIWVGRFERVKDPLLAVRSFASQTSRIRGHLTMVGSGSLATEILSEVQKKDLDDVVFLRDPMSAPELSKVLNQHQILLHTSHFEGSPRVILEAIACGLGVVTLPECDPDGWISKTGAGVYATDRTPEAVGAALSTAPLSEPASVSELIQSRSARQVIPQIEKIITGN